MQVASDSQVTSEEHNWRAFVTRMTFGFALILLGAASICWVAANWQALGKWQRLAGAEGLLIATAGAAAWLYLRRDATRAVRVGRAGALALATVLLGALLALVGQTYQTGANSWTLFAWWAALMLPWALAGRSESVWLLWIAVVNVGATLFLRESTFDAWPLLGGSGYAAIILAAINLCLLAAWELCAARWRVPVAIGPRILVLLGVGVLALTISVGDVGYVARATTILGILWAVATLVLGCYYTAVRRDLVILALLAGGVMGVTLRVAGVWLFKVVPDYLAALPLAALLTAEAVWVARWLRRLAAPAATELADAEPAAASAGNDVDPHVDAAPVAQLAPAAPRTETTPWYVHLLLGFSAWVSTLLLLLFFFAMNFMHNKAAAIGTGVVLSAAALGMARTAHGPFWRQIVGPLGLSGQIMIAIGLAVGLTQARDAVWVALIMLLVAAFIYAFAPHAVLRFLSALVMAVATFFLIGYYWPRDGGINLMIWANGDAERVLSFITPMAVVATVLSVTAFLLCTRGRGARGGVLQPFAWGFALAGQLAGVRVAGVPVWEVTQLWQQRPVAALALICCVLLPAATALAVLWRRRDRVSASLMWGVVLGLLVLSLCWLPAPGVAIALVWVLLGFGLHRPGLLRAGQVALLVYLWLYYSQLSVSLLHKAFWLAGAGAVALVLLALSFWWQRTYAPLVPGALADTPAPFARAAARQYWRGGAIVAGLLLSLGCVNAGIWQNEGLLAHGRVLRLALAPVDPRALMQGDYMALNFSAARDLDALPGGAPPIPAARPFLPSSSYVVLELDVQGVGHAVRVQADPQPHDADQVVLRLKQQRDGRHIANNAYFFPEGKADHYAQARYGELRVDEHGNALLVRLLDANMQPL